jgi:hypothetical protein
MMRAMVCNRGTEPVDSGVVVAFYEGTPESGTPICEVTTETQLTPGDCEDVTCEWATPAEEPPGVLVTIVADANNDNSECLEGNNVGLIYDLYCPR